MVDSNDANDDAPKLIEFLHKEVRGDNGGTSSCGIAALVLLEVSERCFYAYIIFVDVYKTK